MKRSNYTLIIAFLTAAFLAACSAKTEKKSPLSKKSVAPLIFSIEHSYLFLHYKLLERQR